MAGDSGWLDQRGKPARRRLALTVALGEIAGILLIAQTALLVAIGDGAIMRGKGIAELAPYFAGLVGAIALRSLATWAVKRSAYECASIVKTSVRAELIEALRGLGPTALADMHTGGLAELVVDAVEALDGYYSGYLPQRAIATLLPFTVLAVVFPLDWLSGLVLVLTALFLPLSMAAIGEEAHERNRRLWDSLARLSGRFLDALRALATVKMFGASRREAMEIERSSEDYRLATMSVLRVAFVSSFMLELITAVSIAIVAVLTGLRLLSASMRFAPAYFILLIAPEYFLTLRALGAQYHARMEATSAAEQLRKLVASIGEKPSGLVRGSPAFVSASQANAAEPGLVHGASTAPRSRGGARLEFRKVSFGYAQRPILDDLSFELSPGERLALVGPSGCGKSTLVNLVLGLVAPTRGEILLDGRGLGRIDRDRLYEELAWLPQRPTIFHGSMRYNIALGRPTASEAEIRRAAALSHVDEFADELPSGLDTLVGEGGRSLSSGQSQRLALARLFLRSPRLLLLDEPTAHLDSRSEELVNASIDLLAEGRSLILVTHRALDPLARRLVLGAEPRTET